MQFAILRSVARNVTITVYLDLARVLAFFEIFVMNAFMLALLAAVAQLPSARSSTPFAIEVVDEATGRGVPLIELRTVNEIRYVTDSRGVVAFDEPGLMGRSVFFHVQGHGYVFPKDGFGNRGKALDVVQGGRAQLKVRRINIAERLYRVTGAGIYRDSLLVGDTAPIQKPLLNGQVLGSDSVLEAVFQGKIHWFWGDTNRPGYPLGNFHTPTATSLLPDKGGLDPEIGVDLDYAVDADGFAAPSAKMPGDGPTWLDALTVLTDKSGRERMFAAYAKIKPPLETYERGLVEFDPLLRKFAKVASIPLRAPIRPFGHPFRHSVAGTSFVYFADPYPLVRVRADVDDFLNLEKYEAFTCLLPNGQVDRAADGSPLYRWRAGARAVDAQAQERSIKAGKLDAKDALLALRDVETGRIVVAQRGSVAFNDYRKRWVMIAVQIGGTTSLLGEVWFAEADTPLGPWVYGRKIVTHDKYSFYNPKQHPTFANAGGRVIFFEGTYSITFSGNPSATPRYDYNQVMYKLDLADPRLALPVAIYEVGDDYRPRAPGHRVAFFAWEQPAKGTVSLGAFHVMPVEGSAAADTTLLYASSPQPGSKPAYSTESARVDSGSARAVGQVFRNPTRLVVPNE